MRSWLRSLDCSSWTDAVKERVLIHWMTFDALRENLILEYLFWACLLFVAYAYVGYPLALYAMARLRPRPIQLADITPDVSIIIAARNEATRLRSKIENTLALDYPPDRLEVIVVSDHSEDATDDIAAEYAVHGVQLIRSPERRGKEYAQSMAIRAARGAVLVFSDTATRLDSGAIRNIVRSFADASVGCVSSADQVYGPDGRPSGEGAYVRYEMLLRSLESRFGSVIGLSGSFFAARRDACAPWPLDLPSDFNTLLNAIRKGLRGVLDPDAVGHYVDLGDSTAEYVRKVRTVSRGLRSLARNLDLLNPFLYGLHAWQLFSHKLCRWLVPFALLGALAASASLAFRSRFYCSAFFLQCLGYALAAIPLVSGRDPAGLMRLPSFFLLVNASILHAWVNVAGGRRFSAWEPSSRRTSPSAGSPLQASPRTVPQGSNAAGTVPTPPEQKAP